MEALAGLGIAIVLVVILFVLLTSIFWIVELVDAARREYPDPTLKFVWIAIIFFFHFIGAAIYYFVGKQQGTLPNQY